MNEYDVGLTVRFEAGDLESAKRRANFVRELLEDAIVEAKQGQRRQDAKHVDDNVWIQEVKHV